MIQTDGCTDISYKVAPQKLEVGVVGGGGGRGVLSGSMVTNKKTFFTNLFKSSYKLFRYLLLFTYSIAKLF